MKKCICLAVLVAAVVMISGVSFATAEKAVNENPVFQKIEKKYTNVKKDKWFNYNRIIFNFRGSETWITEPETPAKGNPWAWIMEWPGAFADRTGVPALLESGYRVVTFRPGYYEGDAFKSTPGNMNDKRLKESREFQRMLVDELGFAKKGNLIGMSWGGFYSVRYAGAYPECIAHMYLDAPLLDVTTLHHSWDLNKIMAMYDLKLETYDKKNGILQGINNAETIAKAGIPIMLLYGGKDEIVPPEKNCVLFIERFKKAGGKIDVTNRESFGHHPHGLEPNDVEQQKFVDFFNK